MNKAFGQLLACAALALQVIAAQAFPTKAITIVVPTAAGGGNDAMARVIGQKMSALLGQPVIVDNKPGANGSIAAEYVARAPNDGHTLLFGYIATHGINPALQKLRYDPIADFEPIGMVANSPTLLVAHPSVKARDARELVQELKARPGSMSYASAGNGTAPHITAELFKLMTGTDILHVPYKGSAPALTDTIGGTTQLMFPSLFSGYPYVKAGKLKALAIAGDKRSDVLKDVPTLRELGINDVNVSQWYALFAPAKTPRAAIDRLNRALNAALADKEIVKRISDQGAIVETSTPEQLKSLVQVEVARWRKVVIAARITVD